jgi:PAS domain S-box-containing protein
MLDQTRLNATANIVQATLDALPAHIALLDESGVILAVNSAWRSFAEVNGYLGATYGVGANYLDVYDSAAGPDAGIARAAAQGLREVLAAQRDDFSLEYRSETGRRWFTIRASRFVGAEPARVLVTRDDVTKHMLAEEALAESQAHLNEAQQLSHIGSWNWDIATDVLTWSDELYRIVGLAPQAHQITYNLFLTFVHDEDRAMVQQILNQAVREQRSVAYDCRIVRTDRTVRNVHTRVTFVRAGGATARMLGTVQDTTTRTLAEMTLRQQAERLRTLHTIDQVILSAKSSGQVGLVALQAIYELIPYQRGSVSLLDFDAEEAVIIATRHESEQAIDLGQRYSFADLYGVDEVLARLKQGAPYLVDMSTLTPRTPLLDRLVAEGLRHYFCLPLIAQGALIGSLQIGIKDPSMLTEERQASTGEVVAAVAVAMQQARLFEQVRLGRERLKMLSQRLVRAQEDERRQIARELHDEIGQSLTAAQLNLQALGDTLAPDVRSTRLEDSLGLIDHVLQQVRTLSLDLRPSMLDDLGLVPALRWYVSRQAGRAGFDAQVVADHAQERYASDLETTCFRVAQEALTNITRYARARQVVVEVQRHDRELQLIIRDDGQGFDVAEARQRAAAGQSMGLLSMQERVVLIGGHLQIDSAPGQGTVIQARLPLGSSHNAHPIIDRRTMPR